MHPTPSIQIVPYQPQYKDAFKALNEEWISSYFKMEEADFYYLDHPEEHIIDKGGQIAVALYDGEPVGVVAVVKLQEGPYDYEMAKMAVSPKMQGKKIGWLLGKEAIAIARRLGGNTLFLESNTILTPAINLYYKLGFTKIEGYVSAYERGNIHMVYPLGEVK